MKTWGAYNLAMQLSWTLLFSLILPLLGGIWLDKQLHSTPLFVLIGMVLGIAGATVGVARMVARLGPGAGAAGQTRNPSESKAKGEEEPG
jgi:F0F1-type ATP synthase assembly protein I